MHPCVLLSARRLRRRPPPWRTPWCCPAVVHLVVLPRGVAPGAAGGAKSSVSRNSEPGRWAGRLSGARPGSGYPPPGGAADSPRVTETASEASPKTQKSERRSDLGADSAIRRAVRTSRVASESLAQIRIRISPAARKNGPAQKRPWFAPRGVKSCTFRGSRVFHPEELRA